MNSSPKRLSSVVSTAPGADVTGRVAGEAGDHFGETDEAGVYLLLEPVHLLLDSFDLGVEPVDPVEDVLKSWLSHRAAPSAVGARTCREWWIDPIRLHLFESFDTLADRTN